MPFVQPVTFYVPSSSAEPVELKVSHSGLRMVLVNRESVRLLDDSWVVLGVYFLLGPADDAERYSAYVGEVGKRSLLTRIKEHAAEKPWWSRALLIASASDDFNSAEIGWLEGRLYDVLNNAVAADVKNRGRPGDGSLSDAERDVLERYVEPIMAALRACGTSPDTADQKPTLKAAGRKVYRESVKDLIDAGLLKPDTRLHPLRRHLTQTALVLADGSLQVGGQAFTAVSPAAQAVSGNKAEAGWEFWGAPSGDGGFVPLFELRERLRGDARQSRPETTTAVPTPLATETLTAPAPNPAPSPPPAPSVTEPKRKKPRQFAERVVDLIEAGLLAPGDVLRPVRRASADVRARLLPEGHIEVGDEVYGSLSSAAVAVSGNKAEPGWEFWAVDRQGSRVTLYELRSQLVAARDAPAPPDTTTD